MGEYILVNGQSVKLGTCEDLYYVTFQTLQNLLNMGALAQDGQGNDRPSAYLSEKYGWRYRFPFPDEDNIDVGYHSDFDRGVVVPNFDRFHHDENEQDQDDRPGPFYLKQQKQIDGDLWIVLEDGSGQLFRTDHDGGRQVAEAFWNAGGDFNQEMARRILDGYGLDHFPEEKPAAKKPAKPAAKPAKSSVKGILRKAAVDILTIWLKRLQA